MAALQAILAAVRIDDHSQDTDTIAYLAESNEAKGQSRPPAKNILTHARKSDDKRQSGSMVMKKKQRQHLPQQASSTSSAADDEGIGAVEFRSVLRIRPLLGGKKKELDNEYRILEPLRLEASTSVVLHPPPPPAVEQAAAASTSTSAAAVEAKDGGDLLSPSSALVRQTLLRSESCTKTTTTPATAGDELRDDEQQQQQEEEQQQQEEQYYTLDRVFGERTRQDKLYFSLGLPMALQAMEPLKYASRHPQQQYGGGGGSGMDGTNKTTTNLVIGMGTDGSGNSYTCWGGGGGGGVGGGDGSAIAAAAACDTDGLVPRIVDSFFAQSRHHCFAPGSSPSSSSGSRHQHQQQQRQHRHHHHRQQQQRHHHRSNGNNSNNHNNLRDCLFAVKFRILQIEEQPPPQPQQQQPKQRLFMSKNNSQQQQYQHQHQYQQPQQHCKIYDLLEPTSAGGSACTSSSSTASDTNNKPIPFSSSIRTATSSTTATTTSTSSLSAGCPATNNSSKSPSRILGNIVKSVLTDPHGNNNTGNNNRNAYSRLDEGVFVEQDPLTADFRVVNAPVRTCRSADEARHLLRDALKQSRRLQIKARKKTRGRNKQNNLYQSHLYVTMQPALIDRSGRTLRDGGTVAVLDMAGYSESSLSSSFSGGTARHHRQHHRNRSIVDGAVPMLQQQNSAHSAIFHCLRTQQTNEGIRRRFDASNGHGGVCPFDEDDHGSCGALDSIDDEDRRRRQPNAKRELERRLSLKKVPYRQHTLTMLLQPLFATTTCTANKVCVTLLTTAYPGHRDYAEKRSLLDEVTCFRGGPPNQRASTGVDSSDEEPDVLVECTPSPSSRCNSTDDYGNEKSCRGRHDTHHQRRLLKTKPVSHSHIGVATVRSAASDADDEGSSRHNNHRVKGRRRSNPPMKVPTEIISPAPIAVAPGVRMAYSESTMTSTVTEDDGYGFCCVEPLPPPVAPSFIDSLRTSSSSSACDGGDGYDSRGGREAVLPPKATAPVEDISYARVLPSYGSGADARMQTTWISRPFQSTRTAPLVSDFPGVDILSSAASIQSEETAPPPPPRTGAEIPRYSYETSLDYLSSAPAGTSRAIGSEVCAHTAPNEHGMPNRNVFSPMKTFNKVVNASKKKGQRVMEKMGQLALDNVDQQQEVHMDEKLQLLEVENKRVSVENETLRSKNERLALEMEQLRSRLDGGKDNFDSLDDSGYAAADDSPASKHEHWDTFRRECRGKTGLVDDSLLQHMAAVSGGYDSSLKRYYDRSIASTNISSNKPAAATRNFPSSRYSSVLDETRDDYP